MVMLTVAPKLPTDALSAAWATTWPGCPQLTDLVGEADGQTLTFAVQPGGVQAALGAMPAPVPRQELVGPAATSWLWPDGPTEVPLHKAHFIVFASGRVAPLEVHVASTRVIAAVLHATDALGVYWGAAGHVIRADVFEGLAHAVEEDPLPVMLWVDFRCKADNKNSTLFTVGMDKFGLMEIEVQRSTKPVGELRRIAIDLASHLITKGPVVADGETFGRSADERIRVHFGGSMVGRPGKVYCLRDL
jgi:uncharacterized protein DUF4261